MSSTKPAPRTAPRISEAGPAPNEWRPTATTELSFGDVATAGLVGCSASLLFFRGMVIGGFSGVPGDLEDGRLNAFLIEHSWGWLTGAAGHRQLWGLPAFFPAGGNALAFSDPMLSFGFLYWPWRALGFAPDTSYQLWLLAIIAVSVFACHLFLRFAAGASTATAALGAWLASCSASRLHQISHSQLLPFFFPLAAFGGALAWARAGTDRGRRLAAAASAAALVLQFYGGFYLALFSALAIAATVVVALLTARLRRLLWERVRRDWIWLAGIAALAALALVPWIRHYGAVYDTVGGRAWEEVASMLPRPRSWLFVPTNAWAYHWTERADFFRSLPWDFEHAIGLGFFTTALTLWAVVVAARETTVRLAAGAALLLIASTTVMPGGWCAWQWFVELAPPLAAARAVARIGLLLPLAAAVILVRAADRPRSRSGRWVVLLALTAAASEQMGGMRLYDKATQRHWVAEIARRTDPRASAFVVTRPLRVPGATRLHLDAMWAASISGVPTVNGHSGNGPPGWGPLRNVRAQDSIQREEFRVSLDTWLRSQGRSSAGVQWIEMGPDYRRKPKRQRGLNAGPAGRRSPAPGP